MIKKKLSETIVASIYSLQKEGFLSKDPKPIPQFEIPKDKNHGDISTNIALVLGSLEKKKPTEVAERIKRAIEDISDDVKSIEVAGPGFINFTYSEDYWLGILKDIILERDKFGETDIGKGVRVQVEFVSANPTGPLHIGHARGAAVGDAICNILSASGHLVEREYYINDYGVQIETLGKSVFTRYTEHFGGDPVYKENYYQGDYIKEIAEKTAKDYGGRLLEMPEDEAISLLSEYASDLILREIEETLSDFGVKFDEWFSEKSLYSEGQVDDAIRKFQGDGLIYEKDGALWFNTTDYGDDKDRVVIKSDGEKTYLASDIAYHKNKYDRGFNKVINIWGADHHGYVVRMKAAIKAMGRDEGDLELILVQLVNLVRSGKPVSMSTRSGKFVTLREVMDEVGRDAVRYFMLMRSYDSHLDFDLDLAKKKSQENPVYYVQYAHARISSILRQAEEKGLVMPNLEDLDLSYLKLPEEFEIIKKISQFPNVVSEAAQNLEPHRITFYIFELASLFHSYYNHHRVVTEDTALSFARLALVIQVQDTVKKGLGLLGISAPDRM